MVEVTYSDRQGKQWKMIWQFNLGYRCKMDIQKSAYVWLFKYFALWSVWGERVK